MLCEAQRVATRREGYPSRKWKSEAELASSPRRIRPRWNKAFLVESLLFLPLVLVSGTILMFVQNDPLAAVFKLILVPCAVVSLGLPPIVIAKTLKILRFGVPVEGQIVGISNDGVDQLITIYYQEDGIPFEAQVTRKKYPGARDWRVGEVITLILDPRQSGDMRKFAIYPSRSYRILPARSPGTVRTIF